MKINGKKVLVTGGCGFLGGHLINYLLQKTSDAIVIFDKLPSTVATNNTRVTYCRGDILSEKDVRGVFDKYGHFTTVYHLASAMPDKSFPDDLTWKINVSGTRNVVSGAVRYGTKSFVFISSNVTYGIPKTLPVTEKTPTGPLEIYGKSKVQAEKELERFKKKINIQIFRCPVITGVGRLGLQGILFEFISENKNVYVLGDGSNTYQFVDATDVCQALEKASGISGFDIYNIGGDGVMTLRELYKAVIRYAKSTSKIVSLPKTLSLFVLTIFDKLHISPLGVYQYTMVGRSLWADTSKIKKKLGWKPQKTNVDSFIENYEWYVANKKNFVEVGSEFASANRSLPKMKVFKLLKFLS